MEGISVLTDDAILLILKRLDIKDTVAFAYTCERFRRICMDGRVFRQVDFLISSRPILRTQRGSMNKLFMDKQMVQHIKELNLSNHRVSNWQIDDHLEEFIMSISPHLEALHLLNCGVSFQRLHRILRQAPKLMALSWTLWDFTNEGIEFLVKSTESSDEICLKNIKRLHLEIIQSVPHIQILEYLVLSRCKDLEELEIYSWSIDDACDTGWIFPLPTDQLIPGFIWSSASIDPLQHLHSLTVVAVGGSDPCAFAPNNLPYIEQLWDFVFSVVRKKSRETNWKKLWIVPPIYKNRLRDLFRLTESTVSFREGHPHELQAVEAITAHTYSSWDAMDELKALFQRIAGKTVTSLHLCTPDSRGNSILELCKPVSRVVGHALKFLSLSFHFLREMDAEKCVFLHTLFSDCLNITELDLVGCYFGKDVCEPLSKLKYLTKVQLMECAISSKYRNEYQVEVSKANLLTFVENCQNVTHFDVRGCHCPHLQIRCRLTDGDLQALAKLRKLSSLTLFKISGIREWTFLKNITEHCKFLTMLRISVFNHFDKSSIPILMQCAKFLKHFAVNVPDVHLRSEGIWNLLSHAKNLERLCIRSDFWGSLNISSALQMLKSLPRLYVFHVHCLEIENHNIFCDQIIRTLEEEESDRASCFEFLVRDWNLRTQKNCYYKKLFPINLSELCSMAPSLAIPEFEI